MKRIANLRNGVDGYMHRAAAVIDDLATRRDDFSSKLKAVTDNDGLVGAVELARLLFPDKFALADRSVCGAIATTLTKGLGALFELAPTPLDVALKPLGKMMGAVVDQARLVTANQEAARQLMLRVVEAARTIGELLHCIGGARHPAEFGKNLVPHVKELEELLTDKAIPFVQSFNTSGFMYKMWKGKSDQETFDELDGSILAQLESMNKAVNRGTLHLMKATYDKVEQVNDLVEEIQTDVKKLLRHHEEMKELVKERIQTDVKEIQTDVKELLRQNEEKYVPHSIWLEISFDPPPGLHVGPKSSRLASLIHQTTRTVDLLKQESILANLRQWHNLPICFADSHNLTESVRSAHVVMWVSLGSDCLKKSGDSVASVKKTLGELDVKKRPKLLIICMKYGAKRVAEELKSVLPGGIIWMEGDLVSTSHSSAASGPMQAPMMDTMVQEVSRLMRIEEVGRTPLATAAVKIQKAFHEDCITEAGGFGELIPVKQPEVSKTDFLRSFPVDHVQDMTCCQVEPLLTQDIRYVKEIIALLEPYEAKKARLELVCDANAFPRLRSVALHVLELFAGDTRFKFVYRLDQDNMEKFQEKIKRDPLVVHPSLVWVDITNSRPNDDELGQLEELLSVWRSKCRDLAVIVTGLRFSSAAKPNTFSFFVGQAIDHAKRLVQAKRFDGYNLHRICDADVTFKKTIQDLHKDLHIHIASTKQGANDLLDVVANNIKGAFELALNKQGYLAAVFAGSEPGTFALRVCITDVGFLQTLNTSIMTQDFEKTLDKYLTGHGCFEKITWQPSSANQSPSPESSNHPMSSPPASAPGSPPSSSPSSSRPLKDSHSVRADRSAFAETFESSMLLLERLTPHQEAKLEDARLALGAGDSLHIRAPAGAGKTFVALHLILQLLSDSLHNVLFATQTPALCYFFARWLAQRLDENSTLPRDDTLKRLHLLFPPLDEGPRTVEITMDGKIEAKPLSDGTLAPKYKLLVVDEAHHVYSDVVMASKLADYSRDTIMLLLSDVSQSKGTEVEFPTCREIELTEVVRSTRRIISAASTFQIGKDTAVAATACQHAAQGPPLKTYLFDVNHPAEDEPSRLTEESVNRRREESVNRVAQEYAVQTLAALRGLLVEFDDMSLHNRRAHWSRSLAQGGVHGRSDLCLCMHLAELAILVPDENFRAKLEGDFLKRLNDSTLAGRFKLVDAETASRVYQRVNQRGGGIDGHQWIILDTVEKMNGLERLMVMCVGLDSAIDGSNPDVLGTRSLLYRAISRAHMVVIVVNKLLRSGWLAYLTRLRLKKEEHFDQDKMLAESEAASRTVKEEAERQKAREAKAREEREMLVESEAAEIKEKAERQKAREAEAHEELKMRSATLRTLTDEEQAQLVRVAMSKVRGGATAKTAAEAAVEHVIRMRRSKQLSDRVSEVATLEFSPPPSEQSLRLLVQIAEAEASPAAEIDAPAAAACKVWHDLSSLVQELILGTASPDSKELEELTADAAAHLIRRRAGTRDAVQLASQRWLRKQTAASVANVLKLVLYEEAEEPTNAVLSTTGEAAKWQLEKLVADYLAKAWPEPGHSSFQEAPQQLAADAVRGAVRRWQALAHTVKEEVEALALTPAKDHDILQQWTAMAMLRSKELETLNKEEQVHTVRQMLVPEMVRERTTEATERQKQFLIDAILSGLLTSAGAYTGPGNGALLAVAQEEWNQAAEAARVAVGRSYYGPLTPVEAEECVTLAVAWTRLREGIVSADRQVLADKEVKSLNEAVKKREQAVWDTSANSALYVGGELAFDPSKAVPQSILQMLRQEIRKEMPEKPAKLDAGPKCWLSIALQPPPGLLAPQKGRLAQLVRCTDAIERSLNLRMLHSSKALPIQFSRTCDLSVELRSGACAIIWASLGRNYLSKDSDDLKSVKEALALARGGGRLPLLLVVIMKHGARRTAQALSATDLPVIWLRGDVVSKHFLLGSRLVATEIVPDIDRVLKQQLSAEEAAHRIRQAGRAIIHDAGAAGGAVSTKAWLGFPMPKELLQMPENLLTSSSKELFLPRTFHSPCRFNDVPYLLSCDIGNVEKLVSMLDEKDRCLIYLKLPDKGLADALDVSRWWDSGAQESKEVEEYRRLRSLALYACEQFSEGNKYLQVHVLKLNVEIEQDTVKALEALQVVLETPTTVLLWLDVVCDPIKAANFLGKHLISRRSQLSVLLTSAKGGAYSNLPELSTFDVGTSDLKAPISDLHDDFPIHVGCDADLLENMLSNGQLAVPIKRALESSLAARHGGQVSETAHLAAIYAGNELGEVALRVCIKTVEFLQALRDIVLSRDFEEALEMQLAQPGLLQRISEADLTLDNLVIGSTTGEYSSNRRPSPYPMQPPSSAPPVSPPSSPPPPQPPLPHRSDDMLSVTVNRSAFAELFESSMLLLEKLTPHQEAKLDVARFALGAGHSLHIKAPAGAGKTFVALHLILQLLGTDTLHNVLFATRTPALCYFFARWLAQRLDESDTLPRDDTLKRLHLLFPPLEEGPRTVEITKDGKIEAKPLRDELLVPKYKLLVVDEAHHVYSDPVMASRLADYTSDGVMLLLSDVSQSEGTEVEFPTCREIELTEVVRSTKRIISAASTFQLGKGKAKAATTCQHAAQGPPLKTYLFDVDSKDAIDGDMDQLRRSTYAAKTLTAIRELLHEYKGLAILVPDEVFRASLEKDLLASLKNHSDLGGRFEIVNAETASRVYQQGGASAAQRGGRQWILLDTVENVNGLERLMVMCVGLDTAIDGSDPDVLGTRSLLYRAISRAYMVVMVVNELLPSGWLAHLAQVGLKEVAHFGEDTMLAEQGKKRNQTVWDPSGNSTLRDEGPLAFDPYSEPQSMGDKDAH